jgi:hypothetical protein
MQALNAKLNHKTQPLNATIKRKHQTQASNATSNGGDASRVGIMKEKNTTSTK